MTLLPLEPTDRGTCLWCERPADVRLHLTDTDGVRGGSYCQPCGVEAMALAAEMARAAVTHGEERA